MLRFIARLGLLGDLVSAGVIAAFSSVLNFVGVMVLAAVLQPAAFGLLSTCRRIGSVAAPLGNLSAHLAISRYLGYYTTEPRQRTAVYIVAVVLLFLVPAMTLALFAFLALLATHVDWIQAIDRSVWKATAFLTMSLSMNLVVFSTLRGFGHPLAANLQQLAFVTGALALAWFTNKLSISEFVYLVAACSTAVNGGFFTYVSMRHAREWQRPRRQELRDVAMRIARYSLPRIADGPCQGSLSLIGVMLAPAVGGLTLAGYVHMSQAMVRVTDILVVPLSVIFLPLTAKLVRAGAIDTLRNHAQLIYDGITAVGLYVVFQAFAWFGPLLSVAFGDKYAGAQSFMSATIPAMLPSLLYVGFRSVIDGYSATPVNFFNLLASSAVVLGVSLVCGRWWNGIGLGMAYTVGMGVLGWLSVHYVWRQLGITVFGKHLVQAMGITAGAGALAHVITGTLVEASRAAFIASAVLTQITLFLGFSAVLLRLRHPAAVYAMTRMRRARPTPVAASPDSGAPVGPGVDSEPTATNRRNPEKSRTPSPV